MVKRLTSIIEKSDIGKKVLEDKRYRTILFACGSLLINILYTIYNGYLGIASVSYWFITMAVHYGTLSVMRFYIITYELRGSSRRTELSIMRFCGWLFIILGITLSGMVTLTIAMKRNTAHNIIIMIVIATYTFYKVIAAIVNSLKARKTKAISIITLRNINCAEAAASILTLQHSMISTFGHNAENFAFIMDVVTGAGAFIIVLFLGIRMIRFVSPEKHRNQ